MKNDVVNNIRLDINRQKNNAVVHIKAGDTKARTIHFTITDRGIVKNLDDVVIAIITITKPDGNHCYNDLVRQDNELHYTITPQTINVPGECICEVELTFRDGARIGIPGFTIMVYEKYLSDSYIESLNEYKAIPIQIALSKEYAESASASAEASAESEASALQSAELASGMANTANSLLGEFRLEKVENEDYVKKSLEIIANAESAVEQNTLLTQQNAEGVVAMKSAVAEAAQAVEDRAEEILNETNLAKGYAESASASAEASAESEASALQSAELASGMANTANSLLGEFRLEKVENEDYVKKSLEIIANAESAVEQNTLLTQQNAEGVVAMKSAVAEAAQAVEDRAEEILNETNLAKGYAESASASAEASAVSEANAAVFLDSTEEKKQDVEAVFKNVTEMQEQCQNLAKECNRLYQKLLDMGLLELGTTHTTAYYGDLGKIAYDHSQSTGNPHVTTYTDVGAEKAGTAQAVYEQAIAYTDRAIAKLINGAPSTLDTLKEIADVMTEHIDVVEALEAAIGKKADGTETTSLINQLNTRVESLEDKIGYPIS